MACHQLVTRYVQEFPLRPLPADNAPIKPDRTAWLLEQEWCCLVDTIGTVSCDPEVCARNAPATILKERGFLAWVNERSFQCINKVTGQINLTPHRDPGLNDALQPSFCIEECYHVTPEKTACFACVKRVLENPASNLVINGQQPCPALFDPESGINSVDTDLVQQAMQCQNCIASNSANLVSSEMVTDQQGGTKFTHEYNARAFENIWACVTRGFRPEFSPLRIFVLSLIVIIMILALIVETRFFRGKRAHRNASF